MSVILLIVGIVVTGAGLAALGFGIPINEFSLGTTLITAGTTGLCSGLILIGLSAAVSELRRVGDLLKVRPLGQPVRKTEAQAGAAQAVQPPAAPAMPAAISPAAPQPPALPPFTQAPAPAGYAPAPSMPASAPAAGPPAGVRHAAPPPPQRPRPEIPAHDPRRAEPQPAPASSMDVSAAALERLRSSIPRERGRPEPAMVPEGDEVPLSPNGHQTAPARRASLEPALEPRLTPADRLGGAAGEGPKSSRLDFLFRARQATQARSESFDPGRPAETQYARGAPPEMQPRYPETTRAPAAPPPAPPAASHPAAATVDTRPHEPAPATEQSAGILKSGVVDGMAYTLYSDGSIEAKLPDGTVRFGSIAELRAHIEKHP